MDGIFPSTDKMLYENVTIWREASGEYQTATTLSHYNHALPDSGSPCDEFRASLKKNGISSLLTTRGPVTCIKFQIPEDKVISLETLACLEGTIKVVGDYCYITVTTGDTVLEPPTPSQPAPTPEPAVKPQPIATRKRSGLSALLWPF
ncbi:ORF36 [Ictalurid herpesvirus 1]|uniref:Uncharacterized protein ORF36 n=1 Tax=Ictalurid herpesvirus 1 (strain Auburn) TaxID=766178 RepID=VG36_ICHVA|nr:ORF36 [Ictalurid herpesvirus 1]Q00146.1 RecName: Full=Uncharacterized protein ORF36 [Ictalurid herpesvirus 1 (strain Auburn)]AAA88139.1 ORF36 [Ictalurid herpesvirus 1]